MNILAAKFSNSSKELKNVPSLAICAMMLALRVVLGSLANAGLALLPYAKVSINFLPVVIVAILFGPVCAMVVSGLGDILSFMIVPMGPYFPGWTLNAILVGLLYGVFLYKSHKHFILNVIICEILIAILIEIPLGTFWMYITSKDAFWVLAGTRGIKTLIATPIEIIAVFFVAKVLKKVPKV